ncbi:MAG: hypothetical protein ACLPZM_03510 [Thermoplasmata archaeon]
MTDPNPSPPATESSVGAPSGGIPGSSPRLPPASRPARTYRVDGRARLFRQKQAKRRSARWERTLQVLAVVEILLGVYALATARPYSSPAGDGVPSWWPIPLGSPITVNFGHPTESTVNCTGGGTALAESIPWINSTVPLTTQVVYAELYEIEDGDYIDDPGAVANVSATSVCAGTAPSHSAIWYAVLAAPNGTNILGYTEATTWTTVAHDSTNITIEDGSDLILVTATSLAGTGRGFGVLGFLDDSQIKGGVPL